MAQSPESAGDTADSAYAKSWDALGALIARGKSFSGRERNCAFFNVGSAGPSFACASGAVNLDHIDDSRAVIPADWDGDGDLDLWYANRTAPRLRFLRNDVAAGGHWISLKLEGRSCNRDAIGARAELTLISGNGARRTLWRRVKAGDGFLSQTPKTLHFGFRSDENVETLVIRWPAPGLTTQTVAGIEHDRPWKIVEGTAATPLQFTPLSLTAGGASPAAEDPHIRAPLVNRLPVPALDYLDLQGRRQTLAGPAPQPVLVLFWGSWCPVCQREMQTFTATPSALQGLRILALAVDTAKAEPDKSAVEDVKRALSARAWPFDAGFASQATVRTLAVIESRALYPEHALALPSAYLIGPDGKLAVIYHGPMNAEQLIKDTTFAAHPPADAESAVFPFPGISAAPLFPLSAIGPAQALREAGYTDDARAELRRVLDGVPKTDTAGRVAVLRRLADLEDEANRPDAAIQLWQEAVALNAGDPALRLALGASQWKAGTQAEASATFNGAAPFIKDPAAFQNQLGKVWQALGEHARARDAFAAGETAAPDDIELKFNLAVARQFTRDTAGAIAGYEAVLKMNPKLLDAISNLAWLLATAKDARLRQPARALQLAEQVNLATAGLSPAVLDNLAAAQAAAGKFEIAVQTANQALALARAAGEDTLEADIRKHLAAYQSGGAWTE